MSDRLRKEAQLKFEREHPDLSFQRVFRINYLDDEDRKQAEDDHIDL